MAEQSEFFHANEVFFFFSEHIFQLLHLLSFSLSPPLILGRPGELTGATAALRVLVIQVWYQVLDLFRSFGNLEPDSRSL